MFSLRGPWNLWGFTKPSMDPQFPLASRDDIWRLQTDMKNVYATQAEHADRLGRLERRQEDDARMRSVWGNQSPFPSVLSGTPQQGIFASDNVKRNNANSAPGPGYNPAAEAFRNFDQEPSGSLLGSLHLDSEEEPKRGASRANSVRFDESAINGQFGHNSRSSTDFLPMRTGSGLGSHPLTERSLSHKSEGRASSTGHSAQPARANSLGLSTTAAATFMPLGPPPGLFILGPAPSMVRCWMDRKFSNESLLYAAVCTGSYKSVVDSNLISRLGLDEHVTTDHKGEQKIKIPVYLPEATFHTSSTRSSSPAPQLPTLTIEFVLHDMQTKGNAMQIFLGCDVLRARNADILFSLDRLTLLDDDRNKLAVPLVRPENAALYQRLLTTNVIPDQPLAAFETKKKSNADDIPMVNGTIGDLAADSQDNRAEKGYVHQSTDNVLQLAKPTQVAAENGVKTARKDYTSDKDTSPQTNTDPKGSESLINGSNPDTPTRTEASNMWGSWRRDATQNTRPNAANPFGSNTGYQRAGRGRGMKVLKPTRLNTSSTRALSSSQQSTGFDAAPSRFGVRGNQPGGKENQAFTPDPERRSFSSETKSSLPSATSKPRSANPIGGASAFGWLNSDQAKQSPTND